MFGAWLPPGDCAGAPGLPRAVTHQKHSPNSSVPSHDCPEVISKGASERLHPAPEVCLSAAGCPAAPCTRGSEITPAWAEAEGCQGGDVPPVLALATEAAVPRQALGSAGSSAGSQPLAGGCTGQVAAPSLCSWAVAATGTVR